MLEINESHFTTTQVLNISWDFTDFDKENYFCPPHLQGCQSAGELEHKGILIS